MRLFKIIYDSQVTHDTALRDFGYCPDRTVFSPQRTWLAATMMTKVELIPGIIEYPVPKTAFISLLSLRQLVRTKEEPKFHLVDTKHLHCIQKDNMSHSRMFQKFESG